MKQKKRPASQTEAMKLRWKKRIVFEKGYTEMCAEWMAERLEALTDHLQYGHAAIAYQKQNGDFRLVKATLIYYEAEFHKKYEPTKIEGAVVYWNVDELPGGELHGVETDRIGLHHRLHGFSPMNYFYFEKSSEDIFGNPG